MLFGITRWQWVKPITEVVWGCLFVYSKYLSSAPTLAFTRVRIFFWITFTRQSLIPVTNISPILFRSDEIKWYVCPLAKLISIIKWLFIKWPGWQQVFLCRNILNISQSINHSAYTEKNSLTNIEIFIIFVSIMIFFFLEMDSTPLYDITVH